MLTNHAKLMEFFSVADEITGRKKLQKMIYILQKCKLPFEEKYEFHFYGPYSEELTLRVEELCNLGFLQEIKEEKSNYFQYHYHITGDGRSFLQQFASHLPGLGDKVKLLNRQSSRFLELVATMMYFDALPKPAVTEKIHQVKSKQKYTEEEIEQAWEFIQQMKEEDTGQ
ncbi:YwgA family protein [Virgibacillus kimchii]